MPLSQFLLEDEYYSERINITPASFGDTDEHGMCLNVTLWSHGYLAYFIHCVLMSVDKEKYNKDSPLNVVFGTSGGFYSKQAAKILLQVCAAHDVNGIITARNGIVALPLVSLILNKREDIGLGFYLGYSDYRGESGVDFYSVRCLMENGAFMTKGFREEVNNNYNSLNYYDIVSDLDSLFLQEEFFVVNGRPIILDIVNPYEMYSQHLKDMFNFVKIRNLITADFPKQTFDMLIDCRNGSTGAVIKELFVKEFGLNENRIYNIEPSFELPDSKRNLEESNCWLMRKEVEEKKAQIGVTFNADGTLCLVAGMWGFSANVTELIAIVALNIHSIPFYQMHPTKAIARSYTTNLSLKKAKAESISMVEEVYPDLDEVIEKLKTNVVSLYADSNLGIISSTLLAPDGIWLLFAILTILEHCKKPIKQLHLHNRKCYDQVYELRLFFENIPIIKAEKLKNHLSRLGDPRFHLKNRKFGRYPLVLEIIDVTTHIETDLAPSIIFNDNSRVIYRIRPRSNAGMEVIIFVVCATRVKRFSKNAKYCSAMKLLTKIGLQVGSIRNLLGTTTPNHQVFC